LMKRSQMLGPRPSLWAIPSTWYADVAVPNKKPFGKVSLLKPPVSKRTVSGSAAASAPAAHRITDPPAINTVKKKHNGVRDTMLVLTQLTTQWVNEWRVKSEEWHCYFVFVKRRDNNVTDHITELHL